MKPLTIVTLAIATVALAGGAVAQPPYNVYDSIGKLIGPLVQLDVVARELSGTDSTGKPVAAQLYVQDFGPFDDSTGYQTNGGFSPDVIFAFTTPDCSQHAYYYQYWDDWARPRIARYDAANRLVWASAPTMPSVNGQTPAGTQLITVHSFAYGVDVGAHGELSLHCYTGYSFQSYVSEWVLLTKQPNTFGAPFQVR